MKRVKTGILGCGVIAPNYLTTLQKDFASVVEVVACADMLPERAETVAREFAVPRTCTPAALLADTEIELVVNLTPAPVHHASSLDVLRAGKHLFSEKPLALTRAEGAEILAAAATQRLVVAGAADTFLGRRPQTVRSLLAEGRIGTPLAAQGVIAVPMFHDRRYHDVFRGPLLDMAPYYLGAWVSWFGPIARVSGVAPIRFPEKPHAPDSPHAGTWFKVTIPTTAAAVFEFRSGVIATLLVSSDTYGYAPQLEVYGTTGRINAYDPNAYGGQVTVTSGGRTEDIDCVDPFGTHTRGLGVAEMAVALREGRPPRASGALMLHVLEAIEAVTESSSTRRHVEIVAPAEIPEPFDAASLSGAAVTA